MRASPNSKSQRIQFFAACYSFYTPLAALLVFMISMTLAGSIEISRIFGIASLVFCISSLLAGVFGLFRIFRGCFDMFSLAAIVGIPLSLGVGYLLFVFIGLSRISC